MRPLRKLLLLSAAFATIALSVSACASVNTNTASTSATPTEDSFGTYLSAHVAAGQHDLTDAARLYREAMAGDPNDSAIADRAFLYAAASGDMDSALALAKKVVSLEPDNRAARLALAIGDVKHGDYASAAQELTQSGSGPFTTLTLLLVESWAAQGTGNTDAALKDMDSLAQLGGTQQLIDYHKALILDLAGRDDQAEAAYRQIMQGAGNGPRVLESYGRFLERHGRADEAKALYQKALGDDSLEPLAKEGLARVAAGEKPDRLVSNVQDGAAEGLFSIAASLNDATSADIAILYLRFALYLRSDFAMAKIVLADRFEALKKYDDAIAVYRSIDPSSPYYQAAQVQVAIDEGRMDQSDKSIADLKDLTVSNPNDIAAWTSLGDAYRAANDDKNAITAYTHAIGLLNPPGKNDWQLYFARAASEENIKDLPAAEADLQAALKLSPDEPQVLNYLGYTWVDEGKNLPQALAMLEKARSLSPYDGYIVDSVGWAYFRLAKYKEAAQTLQAAVLLVPGDPTINEHLGDAYWMSGQKLDARFQWNHALAFNTDPKLKVVLEQKLKTGVTPQEARAGQ